MCRLIIGSMVLCRLMMFFINVGVCGMWVSCFGMCMIFCMLLMGMLNFLLLKWNIMICFLLLLWVLGCLFWFILLFFSRVLMVGWCSRFMVLIIDISCFLLFSW